MAVADPGIAGGGTIPPSLSSSPSSPTFLLLPFPPSPPFSSLPCPLPFPPYLRSRSPQIHLGGLGELTALRPRDGSSSCSQKFAIASQNLAFRGPRSPGASKAQPPSGLVGHCTSGRPLKPQNPRFWVGDPSTIRFFFFRRHQDVVKPLSITTPRSRAENTYRKVENTECIGLCDIYM